jgi:Uma2 family endonuclease
MEDTHTESDKNFKSTRIEQSDEVDIPTRIGRRESEPHSSEVTHLKSVLTHNFPNHRTLWDLHHYFDLDEESFDIQFDISLFKDMSIPYEISSYNSDEFDGRVPDIAVNILSKSTWRKDFLDNSVDCSILLIPLYIVYTPYNVATKNFRAPYLRVHKLNADQDYDIFNIKAVASIEGKPEIKEENLISLSPILPVRIGIEQMEIKYNKNAPRFRLVLFKLDSQERLLSKLEYEEKRADEQTKRADEQTKRAEKYKKLLMENNIKFEE